jgi:hypothetical protein
MAALQRPQRSCRQRDEAVAIAAEKPIAETNTYLVGAPRQYLIHTDLPVDERVWLLPGDVSAGRDTVVEAALRWLTQ